MHAHKRRHTHTQALTHLLCICLVICHMKRLSLLFLTTQCCFCSCMSVRWYVCVFACMYARVVYDPRSVARLNAPLAAAFAIICPL